MMQQHDSSNSNRFNTTDNNISSNNPSSPAFQDPSISLAATSPSIAPMVASFSPNNNALSDNTALNNKLFRQNDSSNLNNTTSSSVIPVVSGQIDTSGGMMTSGTVMSQKQVVAAPSTPPSYADNTVHAAAPPQSLMDDLGNSIKATNSSSILKIMRMINVVLAIATIASGVCAIFVFGSATDFDEIVAAIYIVLFGMLLLAFELRNEAMDKTIQVNFGFMYCYKQRTVFLIFMAIWPLSISHWVTILDAVALFVNAFFNYYVIYNHPGFAGTSTLPSYTSN